MSPSKSKSSNSGRSKEQSKSTDEDSQIEYDFAGLNRSLKEPISKLVRAQGALREVVAVLKKFDNEVTLFENEFPNMQTKETYILSLQQSLDTAIRAKNENKEEADAQLALARAMMNDFNDKMSKVEQEQKFREAEYEEMVRELKSEHAKKCEESSQALEKRNANKLKSLKAKIEALSSRCDELQAELEDTQAKLDQKTKTFDILERSLMLENERLEKELREIKEEFAIRGPRDDSYYIDRLFELDRSVQHVSATYFKMLHEGAIEDPTFIQQNLAKFHPELHCTPISKSEISETFRSSVAEHIILKYLMDIVWQQFCCANLYTDENVVNCLASISRTLSARSEISEKAWRTLTLQGLESVNPQAKRAQEAILGQLIESLKPFTDDIASPSLREALTQIIQNACTFWKDVQKDSSYIWIAGNDESQPGADKSQSAKIMSKSTISLCLFPKVLRRDMANTSPKIRELHPGRTFSPTTFELESARMEHAKLKEARKKAIELIMVQPLNITTPPVSPVAFSHRD